VASKSTAKLVLSFSIEASCESEASDRFSSHRSCHAVFHPIALQRHPRSLPTKQQK
jgi:hypothetical protein